MKRRRQSGTPHTLRERGIANSTWYKLHAPNNRAAGV